MRFVQLYHRDWDHHGGLKADIAMKAARGRPRDRGPRHATSSSAGCSTTRWSCGAASSAGRPWRRATAATITSRASRCGWPAAGSSGGVSHGATDELGYNAVEDVVHVHDLHATMLHLLGIDHTRLTYRFQGRDFRLTDVAGKVVEAILA